MYLVILFITGALLLVLSIMDFKNKKLNICMVSCLGATCVLGLFFNKDINVFFMAGGLLPGLAAIGFSLISSEQLGMGDGIIITLLGLLLGFRNILAIVCLASFFMALISVMVLALRKGNRHTKLPFVPAIFLSYCFCLVV